MENLSNITVWIKGLAAAVIGGVAKAQPIRYFPENSSYSFFITPINFMSFFDYRICVS